MATAQKTKASATGRTRKTSTKKTVSKKTAKKIEDNAVEKKAATVIQERAVKYNYPDEVKSPLDRKAWRSKTRAKLKSLAAKVTKASSDAAKTKAQRALNKFEKEVLA